jgi:hypothetical protein
MESTIAKIVSKITTLLLTPVMYLLIALSMLYFFWGVALFIFNAESAEKRKEGVNHMLWGGIGLFIIASVWGIINFVDATIKSFT